MIDGERGVWRSVGCGTGQPSACPTREETRSYILGVQGAQVVALDSRQHVQCGKRDRGVPTSGRDGRSMPHVGDPGKVSGSRR